jgi:hypothetical protein
MWKDRADMSDNATASSNFGATMVAERWPCLEAAVEADCG